MKRADFDAIVADAEPRQVGESVAVLPAERFHLADRQLAERIAAEHLADGRDASGETWASIAARIQLALVSLFTGFTATDVRAVQEEHLAVLRHVVGDGCVAPAAKDRSRRLSRLGVLLELARRGRLVGFGR